MGTPENKTKKKRCPKGQHRNKKTGRCRKVVKPKLKIVDPKPKPKLKIVEEKSIVEDLLTLHPLQLSAPPNLPSSPPKNTVIIIVLALKTMTPSPSILQLLYYNSLSYSNQGYLF